MERLNEKQRKVLIGFGVCAFAIAVGIGAKILIGLTAPAETLADNPQQTSMQEQAVEGAPSAPETHEGESQAGGLDIPTAVSCLKGCTWVSADGDATLEFYNYKFTETKRGDTATSAYSVKSVSAGPKGEMEMVLAVSDYGTDTETGEIAVTCSESDRQGTYLSLTSTGFSYSKVYYDSYASGTGGRGGE